VGRPEGTVAGFLMLFHASGLATIQPGSFHRIDNSIPGSDFAFVSRSPMGHGDGIRCGRGRSRVAPEIGRAPVARGGSQPRHPPLPRNLQLHPPAGLRHKTQPFRPLHRQHGPQGPGLLLLLGEEFQGGGGLFQAVEIQMHQGGGHPEGGLVHSRGTRGSQGWDRSRERRFPPVVVGQGKGGAGDRLVDAQPLRQPLHQAGLAGPQVALQQQQGRSRQERRGRFGAALSGASGLATIQPGSFHRIDNSIPGSDFAFVSRSPMGHGDGIEASASPRILPSHS